jgi:hypothetical protein
MNGKQAKRLRDAASIDGTLDEGKYKSMKRMARTILLSVSQAPKFEKVRVRKQAAGYKSLPPQNPLIVIKPVRAIINKFLAENRKEDGTTAPLTDWQRLVLEQAERTPKHRLDALAA